MWWSPVVGRPEWRAIEGIIVQVGHHGAQRPHIRTGAVGAWGSHQRRRSVANRAVDVKPGTNHHWHRKTPKENGTSCAPVALTIIKRLLLIETKVRELIIQKSTLTMSHWKMCFHFHVYTVGKQVEYVLFYVSYSLKLLKSNRSSKK